MKQSIKIIEQCLNDIPNGLIKNNDTKITPPSRSQTKKSMEALIHHFKNYTNGVNIPANETYIGTEVPLIGQQSERRIFEHGFSLIGHRVHRFTVFNQYAYFQVPIGTGNSFFIL